MFTYGVSFFFLVLNGLKLTKLNSPITSASSKVLEKVVEADKGKKKPEGDSPLVAPYCAEALMEYCVLKLYRKITPMAKEGW